MRDSAFPLSYENSSPQNGSLFSLPPSHPPPPPLSGRYQNMPVGAGSRERTRLSKDGLHYMSQPRAAYRVPTLLSRIPNVPHKEMRGHEGSWKVIKGTPPFPVHRDDDDDARRAHETSDLLKQPQKTKEMHRTQISVLGGTCRSAVERRSSSFRSCEKCDFGLLHGSIGGDEYVDGALSSSAPP